MKTFIILLILLTFTINSIPLGVAKEAMQPPQPQNPQAFQLEWLMGGDVVIPGGSQRVLHVHAHGEIPIEATPFLTYQRLPYDVILTDWWAFMSLPVTVSLYAGTGKDMRFLGTFFANEKWGKIMPPIQVHAWEPIQVRYTLENGVQGWLRVVLYGETI